MQTTDDEVVVKENGISKIALPISVAIVGLSVGISLQVQDFTRIRRQPGAAALGLLCQLVVVPAVGWLLTTVAAFQDDLDKELAVGMVLLTLCPGGTSSNYVSVVAGGDGALSVSLTAVSSIVTTFTIPIFLKLAIRTFMNDTTSTIVDINTWQIIRNIALLTLFPVATGMAVRHFNAKRADQMERPLRIVAALLLTTIVVAAIVSFWSLVSEAIAIAAAPTCVLIVGMIVLSYSAAWALRLEQRQRITICVETSIQYSGLAITIGLTMLDKVRNINTGEIVFDPEKVVMPAAVYTLFMYPVGVSVIFFCWWIRGVFDTVPFCQNYCHCCLSPMGAAKRKETADDDSDGSAMEENEIIFISRDDYHDPDVESNNTSTRPLFTPQSSQHYPPSPPATVTDEEIPSSSFHHHETTIDHGFDASSNGGGGADVDRDDDDDDDDDDGDVNCQKRPSSLTSSWDVSHRPSKTDDDCKSS